MLSLSESAGIPAIHSREELKSPGKAAARIILLTENLDLRGHRTLPAALIKSIRGVAIEESALLEMLECKLIEDAMAWTTLPCRIISREVVDEMILQEERSSVLGDRAR